MIERLRASFWENPRRRRWLLAALIHAIAVAGFALLAAPELFETHTRYNHFALLAEGWLTGRLDLGGDPPAHAGQNDFARYGDRWFVVFPPFPALVLFPGVWLAGGEAVRLADGAYFLGLAGLAPALVFLVLEKLARMGYGVGDQRARVLLSLLFAFGTVYFFCAVQGTVWYAAHVVGTALAAAYVLFALGAERPLAAGVALGLGLLTRTPLCFAAPLFVLEAWRTCRCERGAIDRRLLALKLAGFAAPVLLALAVTLLLNWARFGDGFEFGYRYLTVRWHDRIERWGLFDYHYLARNLGVVLTSLPWIAPPGQSPPFQINAHGLALWVTTPGYLWLLWPRRRPALFWSLLASALAIAVPTLFYQNTGWVQFGYRFSCDYAVFLFALFAVGGYGLGRWFRGAAVLSVVVNAFGAATFGRRGYESYYVVEPTQRVLYQPD
ncbi:MAG TPA: hypothetical protein VI197_02600 [Polyangiaceae bacterium]